jgi:hypothetical protein
MTLRLIDVGIPTFELKMKRVELTFSDEERAAIQLKIESGEIIEREAFKKRYELRDDSIANLERYRKLIRKIPATPGKMVITAMVAGKQKTISVFSSDNDLREAFKNSFKTHRNIEIDRFSWLKFLIKEEGYSVVNFRIAKEN